MPQFDKTLVGAIAGIIALIAYIPYFVAILRKPTETTKPTKPNRATWWIWAIVDGLAFESYGAVGAKSTLFVPLVFFIGAFIVALLSIRYGEKGWHKIDKWCLGLAGASIIVRFVFKEPSLALRLNLLILLLGALPTIRKSWSDLASENRTAWILFLVCCVINLFAVEKWNFDKAALPIYAVTANVVIVLFLFLPNLSGKVRKFLADTTSMIILSTAAGMAVEIFISGMPFEKSARARLVAIPVNLLTARLYGVFRDWIFRLMKASNGGSIKKGIADITAFMLFQVPLYAAILITSGASTRQIVAACGTTLVLSAFIGRPCGIFIDLIRKVFKVN